MSRVSSVQMRKEPASCGADLSAEYGGRLHLFWEFTYILAYICEALGPV